MMPLIPPNAVQARRRAATFVLVILMHMPPTAFAGVRAAGQSQDSGLTAGRREALITALCSRIEQIYPVQEVARTTREGLQRKFKAGEYDSIVSRAEFAARMTADLESLSRDKHLDLLYDPVLAAEINARPKDRSEQSGISHAEIEGARWDNFGFKTVRMLEGQVGYLDLRMFFAARYAGETAVASMEFLSGSKAVIIDLRYNGGGWDDMVTLLAGYLVDLDESATAAIAQSTIDRSYYASVVPSFVPGKRLTGIPVYLLTSSRTASAAEAFVSIVKHGNKEAITVGQRTAGAENPVEMVALDDQYVLKIPCYRKVYFGDRQGWEGTGLAPDVEVSADRGLETAHLRALRALQARLTDTVAQEKIKWGIDAYEAMLEPKAVGLEILRSYVGRYRKANVTLEGKNLFVQFDDQPRKRLLAISGAYFLIEDRDDMRLRFIGEPGRITAMEKIYSDGYRSLDMKQ